MSKKSTGDVKKQGRRQSEGGIKWDIGLVLTECSPLCSSFLMVFFCLSIMVELTVTSFMSKSGILFVGERFFFTGPSRGGPVCRLIVGHRKNVGAVSDSVRSLR